MDIEALRIALQEASLLGLAMASLAGFIFAFNPMVFATIPVVLAYVTKAHEPHRAALLSGAFVAGLLTAHAVLGIGAAVGGEWTRNVMGPEWGLFLGPMLILLGLLWPGWLKFRIPWFSMRGRKVSGIAGAFLLGVPFTVALCPACTPALLATITASAAIGSIPFGVALLLAFGVGRSVPVLIGALGVSWLESLTPVARYHKLIEILGGITFIATGLYLIYQYPFTM
jgi:cytochrome c-type biogenesis protein